MIRGIGRPGESLFISLFDAGLSEDDFREEFRDGWGELLPEGRDHDLLRACDEIFLFLNMPYREPQVRN